MLFHEGALIDNYVVLLFNAILFLFMMLFLPTHNTLSDKLVKIISTIVPYASSCYLKIISLLVVCL